MSCGHISSVSCSECAPVNGLGANANAFTFAQADPMAAARVLLLAALDVIGIDGHVFGTRPCSTCTAVSALAGRDFGCVARAKAVNAR